MFLNTNFTLRKHSGTDLGKSEVLFHPFLQLYPVICLTNFSAFLSLLKCHLLNAVLLCPTVYYPILYTYQFLSISEIKKTKLNCFAFYGQRERAMQLTHSLSKPRREQTLRLILYSVGEHEV